jgi:hypothetical protein
MILPCAQKDIIIVSYNEVIKLKKQKMLSSKLLI